MAFGVEAVGGSSNTSGNLTVSFTITAANLLLVGVGVGSTGGGADPMGIISGVTYNGVAMTLVSGSTSDDNTYEGTAWWRLDTPDTGTHNVVVARTTGGDLGCGIVSFTDASLTLRTPSIANNTTTNPSVTVADTASGDIVVSSCANDNDTAAITQSGSLIAEQEGVGGDSDFNFQYQTASGANTVCSWTDAGSGSGWAASGFAVRASGGGGGGGASGRDLMLMGIGA
jgi:hypothetical protein